MTDVIDQELRCKRRRTEDEKSTNHYDLEPAPKRAKTAPLTETPETSIPCECENIDGCSPIDHWAKTQSWPDGFARMSQGFSVSHKKRQRTPSYTQSTRDGDVPRAHTPASENQLAKFGILIDEYKGSLFLSNDSKILCKRLLAGKYQEPEYTLFPLSLFLSAWGRARTRNEARIYRDITPLLVPSAELLFICGCEDLEDIAEEISADWNKSKTLGDPKPRPDFAVGISPTAFTEEEISKLKNHTSFERATLFTANIYFPFLLCEAKCGEQGINRADRQNIHSGSMAVNAIVQLYQALEGQKALQLTGQILVFSISHDNEWVKIYGHYAVLEGEKVTFCRYPIESFTLNFNEGQGRKRTYDFVRGIYHTFYPQHLKRIQSALAEISKPSTQPNTPFSTSDSPSVFKVPDYPAGYSQREENALLREQLAQREEQLAQRERINKEHIARLERLYKEQTTQQEKQYKDQIELLKQLLQR